MKKTYIEEMRRLVKSNLQNISKLNINEYETFNEIRKIMIFKTKLNALKTAEAKAMLIQLQNCLYSIEIAA